MIRVRENRTLPDVRALLDGAPITPIGRPPMAETELSTPSVVDVCSMPDADVPAWFSVALITPVFSGLGETGVTRLSIAHADPIDTSRFARVHDAVIDTPAPSAAQKVILDPLSWTSPEILVDPAAPSIVDGRSDPASIRITVDPIEISISIVAFATVSPDRSVDADRSGSLDGAPSAYLPETISIDLPSISMKADGFIVAPTTCADPDDYTGHVGYDVIPLDIAADEVTVIDVSRRAISGDLAIRIFGVGSEAIERVM